MKKITQILSLGILFLFATTLSLSAQKCKYDYNKKDPITGEATKGIKFDLKLFWEIGFNRIGTSYFLGMEIDPVGVLVDNLLKGDSFIFKLSNGEIVTIYAREECAPAAKLVWPGGYHTFYSGKYDIDVSSLQKIADNLPTYLRMNIGSKSYEQEISAKEGKKISEAARCILQ